jgi:hypothetical protein
MWYVKKTIADVNHRAPGYIISGVSSSRARKGKMASGNIASER